MFSTIVNKKWGSNGVDTEWPRWNQLLTQSQQAYSTDLSRHKHGMLKAHVGNSLYVNKSSDILIRSYTAVSEYIAK